MPAKTRQMIVFSILVVTCGCGLFSCTTGDEVTYARTEVGTPVGDKVTKEIGPEGGTLLSPDGRLTLTVPPNAVTEKVAFSVQPITNEVEDGVGSAYRLEPHGKAFKVPLSISITYSDSDLEGTFPEEIQVGYQDENGAWHVPVSNKVDMVNRRVDVTTDHLSDWAEFMLGLYRISPAKADLRVGESVVISVRRCSLSYWSDWIFFGDKKPCKEVGSNSDNPNPWKLVGAGTLTAEKWPRVIYTAPRTQPKPNVVTVIYQIANAAKVEAKIRIIGTGYRVSGDGGDEGGLPIQAGAYSGVICSLEKPFTIYASANNYDLKFTPSSESSGAWTAETTIDVVRIKGSGTYTIDNIDSDKPRINVTGDVTGTLLIAPYLSNKASGTHYFDLTPLDSDECGEEVQPTSPPGWGPPELKGKGPF